MTSEGTVTDTAELAAKLAWSRRVRYVGGFIQVAFAAFWLVRGGLTIDGPTGVVMGVGFALAVVVHGAILLGTAAEVHDLAPARRKQAIVQPVVPILHGFR